MVQNILSCVHKKKVYSVFVLCNFFGTTVHFVYQLPWLVKVTNITIFCLLILTLKKEVLEFPTESIDSHLPFCFCQHLLRGYLNAVTSYYTIRVVKFFWWISHYYYKKMNFFFCLDSLSWNQFCKMLTMLLHRSYAQCFLFLSSLQSVWDTFCKMHTVKSRFIYSLLGFLKILSI